MTTTIPTVAGLDARAADLLPDIAIGAAGRERHRELPYAQIRRIADAGLLTYRIPPEHGGPGASVTDLFHFLIGLAAADANIAQALRAALSFVEGLVIGGDPADQKLWFPRILAGQIVGNAGWERGGANGEIRARLRRDGDHYRATGTKYYSTGALFADWVLTAVLDPDGRRVAITVPRDREGLRLLDDWDGIGQRLTASGTTELDDVLVHQDEIRPPATPEDSRAPIIPFLQLYLAAVEAGIARNALTDATTFTREHARPIVHSPASRSVDDPYVRHVVGQIAAHAYTAEAVVLRAATAIDRAHAAGYPEDLLTAASVEVATAQFAAVEAALRAGELTFDVGGGSATDRTHNLDRHWRNARTVANHNPRNHKAAVVGAFHLTGERPPTSGLF